MPDFVRAQVGDVDELAKDERTVRMGCSLAVRVNVASGSKVCRKVPF